MLLLASDKDYSAAELLPKICCLVGRFHPRWHVNVPQDVPFTRRLLREGFKNRKTQCGVRFGYVTDGSPNCSISSVV